MNKSDYNYELPAELIAQAPLAQRSASRMLLLAEDGVGLLDQAIQDLPAHLRAGDLLVFNDTKVIPARLFGRKASGGEVEVLIERMLDDKKARAQIRASKSPKPGTRIILDATTQIKVTGREGQFFLIELLGEQTLTDVLQRLGHMPLPPYIRREDTEQDQDRYQTVYAKNLGAVAAPTAGLHFDDALLAQLKDKGVQFGNITLHVGAGTFQPMRVEDIREHQMHSEWLQVSAALVEQIAQTKKAGGRVIAVGTTVVRALESAITDGVLQAYSGDTQIFIYPGYKMTAVDALLTNFHLPESTLLMLVSAFTGRERILAAYQHAVEQRYRFFSYGDAMLIFPPRISSPEHSLDNSQPVRPNP